MSQAISAPFRVQVVAASGQTPLAQLAAAMSLGQWVEVTNGATIGAATFPAPSGLHTAWNADSASQVGGNGMSMAYDANRKRIWYIGMGHGGASGLRHLYYDEQSNTWTRLSGNPSWYPPLPAVTTHEYDNCAYDQINDRLCFMTGGGSDGGVWNPAGGSTLSGWTQNPPAGNYANVFISTATCATAFFPERGKLMTNCGSGTGGDRAVFFEYNLPTNDFTQVAQSTPIGGVTESYHRFCSYNHSKGVVYGGGGNGSKRVWRVTAAGAITQMADCPRAAGDTLGPAVPAGSHPYINPANGNLFVIHGVNDWNELNDDTNTWADKAGPCPIGATISTGGAFAIVGAEIPQYGIIVFMQTFAGVDTNKMWVWKGT